MKISFRHLLLAVVAFVLLHPSSTQGQDPERVTISGTVIDASTGLPIPGVSASLDDLEIQRITDSIGSFTMTDVPLGPHQLTIQREGYETRSGRLRVDQGGEMVLRMNPLGGPRPSNMSRVQGTVRDVDGGDGLEGVAVTLEPLGQTRITGDEGEFTFENVPPGEYQMKTELLGYATRQEAVEVPEQKILTMEIDLAVQPIELDPIEVTVEARDFGLEISGFYQRREATSGLFIARERIEERAPLYTSDLFRGLAGVKVVGGLGMGTQNAVVVSGSRATSFSSTSETCYPSIWIDGQMVHQGSGPAGGEPAFLDQLIQPDQIAGVEIYNSAASIPLQFQLFGGCGVIVFWTRTGG